MRVEPIAAMRSAKVDRRVRGGIVAMIILI
jgi:hypothetical protein